jgi:hypothetical protein
METRTDKQLLSDLARHIRKHGCDAFAYDDEGAAEEQRAVELLEWFADSVEVLAVPDAKSPAS